MGTKNKRASAKASGAVGVTGTPGTGKKSISPLLATLLGMQLIDINSVAARHSSPRNKQGELVVDTKVLGSSIARRGLSHTVVSGHLLSDVVRPSSIDFVVVLRCEPTVLKQRLVARGYPSRKVLENVEAELIGVVLDGALHRFGPSKVHEYDATRTKPIPLAKMIARDYLNGARSVVPWLDWTHRYDSSTKLRSLLSTPRTEPAST